MVVASCAPFVALDLGVACSLCCEELSEDRELTDPLLFASQPPNLTAFLTKQL